MNLSIIIVTHNSNKYIDGSIKAQLSEPNMRTPIQFALTYPERLKTKNDDFDFIKNAHLGFRICHDRLS